MKTGSLCTHSAPVHRPRLQTPTPTPTPQPPPHPRPNPNLKTPTPHPTPTSKPQPLNPNPKPQPQPQNPNRTPPPEPSSSRRALPGAGRGRQPGAAGHRRPPQIGVQGGRAGGGGLQVHRPHAPDRGGSWGLGRGGWSAIGAISQRRPGGGGGRNRRVRGRSGRGVESTSQRHQPTNRPTQQNANHPHHTQPMPSIRRPRHPMRRTTCSQRPSATTPPTPHSPATPARWWGWSTATTACCRATSSRSRTARCTRMARRTTGCARQRGSHFEGVCAGRCNFNSAIFQLPTTVRYTVWDVMW